MRKVMNMLNETHQYGHISIENIPIELESSTPGEINDHSHMIGDIGIQIAEDGRIWICINGIAFLRFSPHLNGLMQKSSINNGNFELRNMSTKEWGT
jgi:hypothetical protein